MRQQTINIIVHAPNIHLGGGLVLLNALLSAPNRIFRWMQLDERSKESVRVPSEAVIYHVSRSILSRLLAEWRLWRNAHPDDLVLCFHGLPPLLPIHGRVVVFVQNRFLVEKGGLRGYSFGAKVRIMVERLWIRAFQHHCTRYIVQTASMASSVKNWLRHPTEVSILPFLAATYPIQTISHTPFGRVFDFVYVASGDPHKNHINLLKSWCLLAQHGLKPSLALTVDTGSYPLLCRQIAQAVQDFELDITNLGQLPIPDIHQLYCSSSALIFPSRVESFGLPLIEASQMGLPILAAELDFVRDVAQPVQTFDPNSAISIARAVRRFLDVAESIPKPFSAEEFLAEVAR